MPGASALDWVFALDRVRRHGSARATGRCRAIFGAIALWVTVGVGTAQAAPVRGTGTATVSKSKTMSKARSRALHRARRSALQVALGQVSGSVDRKARKSVLDAAETWTGAYRIVSETHEGGEVRIEVEVEVDLVRLTKRVGRKGAPSPAWGLGQVTVGPGCGEDPAVTQRVEAELSGQGLATADGKGPKLDVSLECEVLGPVTYTYLYAARVSMVATVAGQAVAQQTRPAFAQVPPEAVAAGIGQVLLDTSDQLATRGRGWIRLKIRSPMPSARVRRLEAAMRNSVLGVDGVEVVAIERGVVELRVRGRLDAKALAGRLRRLSLPGFSLSVVDVDPPDALTVRLD